MTALLAPYEVHFYPNVGGGGIIPESQRNGSSTGHRLPEGTYYIRLLTNTSSTCYISYSQGIRWVILGMVPSGDADVFRSSEMVPLAVGPDGGTIRVTATPGHTQEDVDQKRLISLSVLPFEPYSPEMVGGGGSFFQAARLKVRQVLGWRFQ